MNEATDKSGVTSERLPVVALLAMALVYTGVVAAQMSEAYIDFGDGNYLYIASRLLDGKMLYRDILSPQPPLHVCAGALLLWFGRLFGQPLYTVRVFSLLLHLFTVWLVARLALRLFASRMAAGAAAVLYLLVPIGFWWTLGYQSEPFEMAFLLASTLFFLDFKVRPMLIAGLLAAGAPFCNITAIPFLVFNIVFLLVCRRELLFWYLAPLVAAGGVVAGGFEAVTGAYFQNVLFNQVGTFPKEEILGRPLSWYVVHKLKTQGLKVLLYDGAWISWGVAGLFFLSKDNNRVVRVYAVWLLIAGLLSIGFVAKGATMDYIFSLGEPILCVAGGGMWATLAGRLRRWRWKGGLQPSQHPNQSELAGVGALSCLAVAGMAWFALFGAPLIARTLRGDQYELKGDLVHGVNELIERYSKPGDAIIAHPYFAFITGRTLVEEYSEIFIWNIKYENETKVDRKPGEGVAKIEAMARALRGRRVPIVLLDMKQTGQREEIQAALKGNYKRIGEFNTLNTPFRVFVPVSHQRSGQEDDL